MRLRFLAVVLLVALGTSIAGAALLTTTQRDQLNRMSPMANRASLGSAVYNLERGVTLEATTGNGWTLDASTITSGTGLLVKADNDILNGGYFAKFLGGTGADTLVWAVGEDGAQSIVGTVATTSMLSITNNAATTGDFITLTGDDDTLTTGAYYLRLLGGTDHATEVLSIAEGGATTITPSAASAAVDAISVVGTATTSGDLLQLSAVDATLNGGKYINALGGAGSTAVFTVAEDGVTAITSTAAASNSLSVTNNTATTGDLVTLTADDDALTTGGLYLSCLGGTDHATSVFSIAEGGATTITPSAAAVAVDAVTIAGNALTTGDFLSLTADDDNLNGGLYLNCLGGTGANTAVFTVGEDGVTAIASTVATSLSLSVTNNAATTGDLVTLTADDDTLTTGGWYVNILGSTDHATQVFGIAEGGATLITPTAAAAAVDSLAIAGNVLTTGDFISLTADDDSLDGGKYINCIGGASADTAVFTVGEGGVVAAAGAVTISADGTGADLQLYTDAAGSNLLWDASDNRLEGTGETYVLIGETTTGVNNASPNPMIYGRLAAKTTAVTGDGIGVRGNARTYIASPAGSFYGGYFQAGSGSSASGTDGVNAGTLIGALSEVVSTTPAAATTTISDARGLYVSLDANQDAVNFTSLIGIKVNSQLDAGGTMGTYSASHLLYLENEAVGGEGGAGTGAQVDNAIYVKSTNHSGGIKGFNYGLNFSGATFNASGAEILLSNSESIDNLTNGTLNLTATTTKVSGAFKVAFGADDYLDVSVSDGGTATYNVTTNGTALHSFSDPVSITGNVDTTGTLTTKYGADDYITWTVADAGSVTADITTNGTALLAISDPVAITGMTTIKFGADDYLDISVADNGTTTFNVTSNGTANVSFSDPVTCASTLAVTGALTAGVKATDTNATDTISGETVATYYGKVVFLTHADAVAVTLPANGAAAGSWVQFILAGDDSLAVVFSAATADTLIAPNNSTADSVTFGSGHRMAASVTFISNGTYWVALNSNAGCTMTVTDGA